MNDRLQQHEDEGAVGVLAIGLIVILLLVIATVVAVTSVYVTERRLQLLADECSDAATARIVGMDRAGPHGPRPVLDAAGVRGTADTVIASAPQDVDGIGVAQAEVLDAQTAHVVLTGTAHPPIVSFFLPDGVQVQAESTSRVRVVQ